MANFAQNKADSMLGDLLTSWGGRSYLFEFKRDRASLRTELQKPHRVVLLRDCKTDAALRTISRQGHLLIWGNASTDAFVLEMAHYTDLEFEPTQLKSWSAEVFLREFLLESRGGLDPNQMLAYLGELERRWKATGTGAGREASAATGALGVSALVVNVDEAGAINFLPCDLDRALRLQLTRKVPSMDPPARGGQSL